jgi:hypothetical protein
MTTMRGVIEGGFGKPSISVRQTADAYQLPSPISLRSLIEPEQIILKNERTMSAGSLSGWAQWGIQANGIWSFRGHLHSSASIIGDNFVCSMYFDCMNTSGTMPMVKKEGELSAGSNTDWEEWGHSPWIAQNWQILKNQNFRFKWKLQSTWDMTWIAALAFPLVCLAPYIFWGSSKGHWTVAENGDPRLDSGPINPDGPYG